MINDKVSVSRTELDQAFAALDPNWTLKEDGFHRDSLKHYESIFALGTGYLTSRSCIEEELVGDDHSAEYTRIPGNVTLEKGIEAISRWGTFMPVVQANHPLWRTGIVNLPHYLGLTITIDGELFDPEHAHITSYRRWLDLKSATLYRSVTWRVTGKSRGGGRRGRDRGGHDNGRGPTVELLFRRYMDPQKRFACVQELELRPDANIDVELTSYLDNDVRTNGVEMFTSHEVGAAKDAVFSDVTTNRGDRVVTASTLRLVGATAAAAPVLEARSEERASRRIAQALRTAVAAGETLHAVKSSFVAASPYFADDVRGRAETEARSLSTTHPVTLHAAHTAAWETLWDRNDVTIEADDPRPYNSRQAIRAAIYHLLRAKAPTEDRALVCPKGTTSELYLGSAFWDMEIFIQPFYIYTDPLTARTTHMFRYHALDGARQNATLAGYSGARYPWQSDRHGYEATPESLYMYYDHQVHISADVVAGIWHYVQATGDRQFLYDHGAEIIFETARFWVERVDAVVGRPGYQILGVMGPDEYTPYSNNNAYTNFFAKFALSLAGRVHDEMLSRASGALDDVIARIGLTEEELSRFASVAEGLSVPRAPNGEIILQCDDYDTAFAEINIDALWTDRSRMFGEFVSQEKRYRSKVMKQSDVVALLATAPDAFSQREKAASFDYYAPLNTHESSNSMCHHMIAACDLGRRKLAYESWLRSIDIDFGDTPRSGGGIHSANVGGMWQEVVHGFAGMRSALFAKELRFHPCLPKQIMSITYDMSWRGAPLTVTVERRSVTVLNRGAHNVEFIVAPAGLDRGSAPEAHAVAPAGASATAYIAEPASTE